MSAIRQSSPNDPDARPPTDTQVSPQPPTGGRGGESHDAPPGVVAPVSALARFRRIAASLLIADACCILGALFVANKGHPGPALVSRDLVVVLIVAPIVWVATFHSFGLYGVRHLSAPEELRRLVSATTLGVVIIMVGSVWWEEALDRSSLAVICLVALLSELLVRRLTRWHIRKERRSGNSRCGP